MIGVARRAPVCADHSTPREPLSDPYLRQWRRLLLYGSRDRRLVGCLYAKTIVRYYCPYPIDNELHLGRNTQSPWDDDGLPVVVAVGNGTYSALRGDGSLYTRGLPEEVAESVAVLLVTVKRPRHRDSRAEDRAHARERAWPSLASSADERVRRVARRLSREPEARRYHPYASHHDVRLSRGEEYPWDDEGLPQLSERGDGSYLVVDGDGQLRGSGDLAAAVAVFVQLLAEIRTRTHDFRAVFRAALLRGDRREQVEILRRYRQFGLGQREAHDALTDLAKGLPDPAIDRIIDLVDVVDGRVPADRIWDTELDL